MKECSKSIPRRLHDPAFGRKYFVGGGLDIGGFPDPLSLYVELFPLMTEVRVWDIQDGDAQRLEGIEDERFDFVHSSHCLEHMVDPKEALATWMRVLRPGGHLILTVPDEDLYEQGKFPSTWNRDHKWSFTIYKEESFSPRSLNLLDLARDLGRSAAITRLEQLASTYRFDLPRYDQTLTPVAECGIELVVRKRTAEELAAGGCMPARISVDRETRIHLNQYRDDQATLRGANADRPPFTNDDEV
jgi:SAM-dependent methyltransferase